MLLTTNIHSVTPKKSTKRKQLEQGYEFEIKCIFKVALE